MATYAIAGCQYNVGSIGFVEAIASAHAAQQRPRCMCKQGGIETYVAKLNDGYVVKRMPETGNQHAATCPHFEPAAEATGLAALSGTAIREDPVTGLTSLKLDFTLSRSSPRMVTIHNSGFAMPKSPSSPRLSMRGLLLFLWEQAGLMRWQPGFAGKRPWATVRRRLLQAASDKIVCGQPLLAKLFVPEPFSVEQREALNRRRATFWSIAAQNPATSGQLLLLIGEVKEIAPARSGFRAVIKQIPDLAFIVNERLYSNITRNLHPELALWNAAKGVHMLVMGTFSVGMSGIPTFAELTLVAATSEWIPIENTLELDTVTGLVSDRRAFRKYPNYMQPRTCSSIFIDGLKIQTQTK